MSKLNQITPEEFKLLYNSMSQKKLSQCLNVTVNTIMKRVKDYSLERKAKGRPPGSGYLFKGESAFSPEVQSILNRIDS